VSSKIIDDFIRIHPHLSGPFEATLGDVSVFFTKEKPHFVYEVKGKLVTDDTMKKDILGSIFETSGIYKNLSYIRMLKREPLIKSEEKLVKDFWWAGV